MCIPFFILIPVEIEPDFFRARINISVDLIGAELPPQSVDDALSLIVGSIEQTQVYLTEITMSLRGAHTRLMKIEMMRKIISHLLPAPRGCYALR